jgi:hypothetical protein
VCVCVCGLCDEVVCGLCGVYGGMWCCVCVCGMCIVWCVCGLCDVCVVVYVLCVWYVCGVMCMWCVCVCVCGVCHVPITQICQILSCDTLVANERYVTCQVVLCIMCNTWLLKGTALWPLNLDADKIGRLCLL